MTKLMLLKNRKAAMVLFFLLFWASPGISQISGYILEYNGQRIQFSMVSGLGESTPASAYPGRTLIRTNALSSGSVKTVTLQKVRCSSGNELYKWFCSFSEPARQKRDIGIKLLNMNGDIIKAWRIYQATPSKMEVPLPLDAEANDVLIETLVLTYEKVEPDL